MLGHLIGRLLMKIGKKRKHVANTNLKLCFPKMSEKERHKMLVKNFENTGVALLETGMGWWWPNWRVKRKVKIKGIEHIENAKKEGNGVLLLAMHNLTIEVNLRGIGYSNPLVVFYRPHNNPLMEFFQYRGRVQSNKAMLGKKDVKGLIQALKEGDTCVYLPDQDYGRKKSLFVPFFDVKDTASTTGTLIFARQPNVKTMMAIPTRNDDNSGYTIEITPAFENFPTDNDEADIIRINQELEKAILKKPEQYMWLHRRFKTRPSAEEPSPYK
jgi:KDO2-lipid IV(A) lauroyltransferase